MIQQVNIYYIQTPLTSVYRLSFGNIKNFDSIFCYIKTNSYEGIGECTPLYGYNLESIQSSIRTIKELGSLIINKNVNAAKIMINRYKPKFPFATSAILSALDIEIYKKINRDISLKIPLTGNIDLTNEISAINNLESLLNKDYTSFKVKIGRNLEKEIRVINSLLKVLPSGMYLKCDANNSLSFSDSLLFSTKIKIPEKIEYLEQPFFRNSLKLSSRFQEMTGISIALDESIYSQSDIRKSFNNRACKFIKLKLMKHGNIKEIKTLFKEAKQLGLEVIIGNGVQTEWGCLIEGIIHNLLKFKSHGEMTGFLKQKKEIIPGLLEFSKGNLICKRNNLSFSYIKETLHNNCLLYNEIY